MTNAFFIIKMFSYIRSMFGFPTEENKEIINFRSKEVYFHGTNSSVLNMFPLTDFSLINAIDMIEKYRVAPLCGEIEGGGYDSFHSKCDTCFEKMGDGKNAVAYTARKYMGTMIPLGDQLKRGPSICYSNINIILIYYVRCQQLGYNVDGILNIPEMKKCLNVISTFLFLEKWLKCHNKQCDKINISFENLLENIDSQYDYLDIFSQYEDSEKLPEDVEQSLLKLYNLPEFLTTENIPYTHIYNYFSADYLVYRLTQNCRGFQISDLLCSYANGGTSSDFWNLFRFCLCQQLQVFRERINLLEKMSKRDNFIKINSNGDYYPLIFICENGSQMKKVHNEYRANCPLKIGTDIKYIATDTEANLNRLDAYLKNNNLDCKAILFSQIN
jgi:hypothetical protein